MSLAPLSRRHLLAAGSTLLLARPTFSAEPASAAPTSAAASSPLPDTFPAEPPELVREMVGVSHFNLARVGELVEARPALARATWDWGFGDFESALGAASHVGNREIAELLIAHGARPDLFSATMLGQLEVVKAWIAASPGIQKITGPHGITLLSHAKAGGERALPVLSYLETLGDADPKLAIQPLADADRDALLGSYVFGPGKQEVLVVEMAKVSAAGKSLAVRRGDGTPRALAHRGERAFSPAGAEAVRLRFSAETPASTLTVWDPDLLVTAKRLG
jgi:hypothetical protein